MWNKDRENTNKDKSKEQEIWNKEKKNRTNRRDLKKQSKIQEGNKEHSKSENGKDKKS
jgi:hypothetical protein